MSLTASCSSICSATASAPSRKSLTRISRAGRAERTTLRTAAGPPDWQGTQMNAIAPTRPTVQHKRRISLPAGPTAAAAARSHVRAAVYAWDVPVDTAAAVLLTSELVTNAIRHE